MTIQEANQQLVFQLAELYDQREALNIADWTMEHLTGLNKIDRVINKHQIIPDDKALTFRKYAQQLKSQMPVQYVLNEAWFCGWKFFVNENVLIPRPETEELVAWVVHEVLATKKESMMLDIGTGSGCIPVALKKKCPNARVSGCDISAAALEVAQVNALSNNTEITFIQADILDAKHWHMLPKVDIIVSNPPYIPFSEHFQMHRNVTEYEPHQALFVKGDDPLLFYRAIAEFGGHMLEGKGKMFVEVHENFAGEVASLFTSKQFRNVEIRKDLQGKERMIMASATEHLPYLP